jgi:hypothetical protein
VLHWGRLVELSLGMLVRVRRRAQPWAVRWESFAGAMRGDDRHRADTSEGERLARKTTPICLVPLRPEKILGKFSILRATLAT